MRKLTYYLIAIIGFSIHTTIAQCDIQELRDLLYSSSISDRVYAAKNIADCKLAQLIPEIELIMYEEESLYAANVFLFALDSLHSNNLHEISLDFISFVDSLNVETFDDPLKSKVYATRILFDYNDYTTIDFVFQIVDRDRPNFNDLTISLLLFILNNNNLTTLKESQDLQKMN